MHKSQIFGYFLISFLAGVFIASFIADPTSLTLWVLIAGTIVIAVSGYHKTFARTKKAERNRVIGVVLGVSLLFVALGMFRYGSVNLNHDVLTTFAGREAGGKGITLQLDGYIAEEPSVSGSNLSIPFVVKKITIPGQSAQINEKTMITAHAYGNYQFGQQLTITGALSLPQNFGDSGFDYIQYLKNKDIRTVVLYPKIASATNVPLSLADRIKINIYGKLFTIKSKFESSINKILAQPYAAYINGVLLGTRSNIPQSLTDAFNKTSTTHILAISGYNITIIAEALLAVLVYFTRRRVAFWISVVIIILFTILTGASASVVRAAVMGLLLLTANGYGRWYDPKNSILVAAGVMVWFNPSSLRFDIGFQLSFLAVIGLMLIYPILNQKTKRWPKLGPVKETLLMTIAAQIMVAPLLVYYFHQFSLVSLPANLLVLPLMPLTMLFGFLTGLGGLIFVPLGKAIGLIAFVLAGYQIGIIKWFGGLAFSSLNITIYWVTLCVMYAILIFAIWKMRTKAQT